MKAPEILDCIDSLEYKEFNDYCKKTTLFIYGNTATKVITQILCKIHGLKVKIIKWFKKLREELEPDEVELTDEEIV